ncbi:hypothetical protein N7535_000236 [Penicillium sp. DV-2018c]|nr:hypothetical protein N7535_000236 [Penicillium sp. DV-2018c]
MTARLPSDIEEWKEAAQRAGVNLRTSVHTRGPFMSGSRVVEEEFLLLRTIWPKVPLADKWQVQKKLGLDAQFRKADDYLGGIQEFENYLDAIGEEIPPKNTTNLGLFWLPYEQQQRLIQILKSGPTTNQRAYGKNEELVNASLVNFLQAVCGKHRDVHSDWNPARVKLTFDFRKIKMGKETGELRSDVFSLSCQIDGFLESSSTFRAQAILEAKALGRKNHEPKVSWQETMEMVTALLTEHPKKKLLKDRVTLFAQTGAEMYLLHASHKDGYSQYMQGAPGKRTVRQDEFVEIRRYGPYLIAKKEDVGYFAKLALAVALRASEEEDERT